MLVTLAVGMSAPSASGWGPTETLCTFHADGRPEGFVLWETRHSFRWRRLQSARKPSPCPICPSATFSPPRSCLPRLQRLLCPRGAGGRGRGGQGLGPRSVQDHAPQLASALGMSLESGPSSMCSPSLGAGPEWATWALSGMIRDIQGCASLPTPATHYRHPVSSALDIFFIFITALVAGTRG